MSRSNLLLVLLLILAAAQMLAQAVEIQTDPVDCLPVGLNAAITTTVDGDGDFASVRLYFRRFSPVGSFYYTEMFPIGNGVYTAVLPRPEDRTASPMRDSWWSSIRSRDWLKGRDQAWLTGWLDDLDQEPVEYFVAVHDGEGERIDQTPIRIVEVQDPATCGIRLSQREELWAARLTVGETADPQADRVPFHWSCEGVAERITPDGEALPHTACSKR